MNRGNQSLILVSSIGAGSPGKAVHLWEWKIIKQKSNSTARTKSWMQDKLDTKIAKLENAYGSNVQIATKSSPPQNPIDMFQPAMTQKHHHMRKYCIQIWILRRNIIVDQNIHNGSKDKIQLSFTELSCELLSLLYQRVPT